MAATIRPQQPSPDANGHTPMTLEQFLAWEEEQELRYEFLDGHVRSVQGWTMRHNTIVGNILDAVHGTARARACRAHALGMQVHTPSGRVYYPDVVVGCGTFSFDDTFVRNPCVVVEVASPWTYAIDREEKRDAYATFSSVRAYVVVEQAVRRMTCYVRRPGGSWAHVEVSDTSGVGAFETPYVGAVLTLDAVYEDTDVPLPPPDLRILAPRTARAEAEA